MFADELTPPMASLIFNTMRQYCLYSIVSKIRNADKSTEEEMGIQRVKLQNISTEICRRLNSNS